VTGANAGDALGTSLEVLIAHCEALERCLARETEALPSRDLMQLGACAEEKEHIARMVRAAEKPLDALLAGRTVREFIAEVGGASQSALETRHARLKALAENCRHQNAVNGKVIHRTRQSLAELARILSGHDADPIYTARGTTRPTSDGHSLALA